MMGEFIRERLETCVQVESLSGSTRVLLGLNQYDPDILKRKSFVVLNYSRRENKSPVLRPIL